MRKLIVMFSVFSLVSCKPFSYQEEKVLLESKSLLSNVIAQRQNEVDEAVFQMDRKIYAQGDNDRWLYAELNDKLSVLSLYNFPDQENGKIIRDIVPDAVLIPEFPPDLLNYYETLDSILKQNWIVSLKENMVHSYDSRLGIYCSFYRIIMPFVECESSELQQGQSYRAAFYLGELIRSKIEGPGVINNEIKYLPEPTEGKKVWKGKIINFRDTIDVEIPYEIVYCNEDERI